MSTASFPAELLATAPDSGINALMAAADWSSTPLGPVAAWPSTLRTSVSVCLNSRFPMLIWWGPDLAMVYNDAYVPILGAKHPQSLGRPGAQVWADVWPVVGDMLAGVIERGEATYDEDLLLVMERHGFTEEAYFTFSYSPILEADGTRGGVFTAVTETTGRVLSTRRLAALQALGGIRGARTGDVRAVCASAMDVLAGSRADLPFGMVYLTDEDGAGVRVAASYGLRDEGVVPARVPDGDVGGWIWRAVTDAEPTTTSGLAAGRPRLIAPGASPAGDADVDTAVALPLTVAGQDRPVGALVVGISPYLQLDADYSSFLELVAGQVTAAVIDAQAYEAERRRAEELAALDRAKSAFFTNVSHELRTPLALIAGPAEDGLADVEQPLPPVQRERLELVHRNAGRLRRMVDTLLDFSRIEDGRLAPELAPVDLGTLTRGIAESFAPAADRAGLTLDIDSPDSAAPVLVDPAMWEKIVLNLLSNAVKFTPAGEVRVRLRADADTVRLQVGDTGVGIPAEELPRVFERFHRVRGAAGRSFEGTGIGLALVAELAVLHGGRVSAESRPGEGSTFTVTLPVREASGAAVDAPITVAPSSAVDHYREEALQWGERGTPTAADPGTGRRALAPDSAGATVLVADDNADLRRYLGGLLEPGYRVLVAADGEEALRLMRAERPDLVLADVMMPRLDGWGLLRAVRADPATAGVPVILLSARAGEQAAIEGLAAGADDYLVKPFSSAELLARVRSTLDLARSRSSESAWRTALTNALQDGFFVATPDGTAIEVNEAFGAILGYGPEGVPYPVPSPWWPDPEDDPEAYEQVAALLAVLQTRGSGRFVVRLRHRAGHTIWADLAIDSVRDPDGTQRLIVGTLREVTAEHLAAERDAALARLAERLGGIDDPDRLLDAAVAELRELWQARRVSVVTWTTPDGQPRATASTGDTAPGGAELPPAPARGEVLAGRAIITSPQVVTDRAPVTAVGAPLAEGTDTGLVWLEFGAPRPFTTEDRSLLTTLCGHLQQALSRARAYQEQRTVALALQRSILGPATLPDGFAVRYEPAAGALEVGGDWYDVVSIPDGRFAVVVGDVVGRGLDAAAVMGQLRSAARALLLERHNPADVLTALDTFAALVPGAGCSTVFCALIDPEEGSVCYSSAGHLPAILVHADGSSRLLDDARSLPLAVGDAERREVSTPLPAGTALLLYTDGLIERRREDLRDGIERAVAALADARDLALDALVEQLCARLLADRHDDDVAFLLYRRQATPQPFTRAVPAAARELGRLRRDLRAWLLAAGAAAGTADDLVMATEEATSNAIEHGYRLDPTETVHVAAMLTAPDRVDVVIRDTGHWVDPDPDPGHRRRGLQMMRALTDEVDVASGPAGTTVSLTRRLDSVPTG